MSSHLWCQLNKLPPFCNGLRPLSEIFFVGYIGFLSALDDFLSVHLVFLFLFSSRSRDASWLKSEDCATLIVLRCHEVDPQEGSILSSPLPMIGESLFFFPHPLLIPQGAYSLSTRDKFRKRCSVAGNQSQFTTIPPVLGMLHRWKDHRKKSCNS
jgi:hypothetical protein